MPKTLGENQGLELLSICIQRDRLLKDISHCTLELRLSTGQTLKTSFVATELSLESLEQSARFLVDTMEKTKETFLTPPTRLYLRMLLVNFAQWLWSRSRT